MSISLLSELRLEHVAQETAALRKEAKELGLWLVLGSVHFLDEQTKPTNCLYLIDPQGRIADRYDKCMCTGGDQKHYSAGNHLVTHDIRGVRIGLAICYDICWPQIYMAYREKGVTLMIHSFHNARGKGPNCLDVLNVHQVPTRCTTIACGLWPTTVTAVLSLGLLHRPARCDDRQAVGDQPARSADP